MNKEELEQFRKYREKMNASILGSEHLGMKRFFNLDTQAYVDGALNAKTKEMLGLVASMVLRCLDCRCGIVVHDRKSPHPPASGALD